MQVWTHCVEENVVLSCRHHVSLRPDAVQQVVDLLLGLRRVVEDALGLQDCLLGLEERQAGSFELTYPSLGHVGLAYQRMALAKGLLQLRDQGVGMNEPRGKLPSSKHLPDLREAAVHREAYRRRELVSWQMLRHVVVTSGLSVV